MSDILNHSYTEYMSARHRLEGKKMKKIVVAVSGGFDPVHVGHIRMFAAARRLGNFLIVIINNDNWLRKKKGAPFLPEQERKEIIESLRMVDGVVLTRHPKNPSDMSVSEALRRIRPQVFANGGDRTRNNIPEVAVCRELGTRMVFSVGGKKIQSSSWLLKKFVRNQK